MYLLEKKWKVLHLSLNSNWICVLSTLVKYQMIWLNVHFQPLFSVCWVPWPPQMWTQPSPVWSLLWKVWRQFQFRNGSYTWLDPCTLWPPVCQGAIFHPWHPRGQKGHRCSIHNNQQTRSRSYSLKVEHHIYKSTSKKGVKTKSLLKFFIF